MTSGGSPAFGAQGIDVADRPVDDGERAQPEEVELDQSGRLDVVLVELRDRRGAALLAVERREIREHGRRDDDAARVRAGVAGEPFERAREIDELAHLGVALVQPPQLLFLLERLVERDADLEGNELRDLVDVAVVVAEHPADVANHRFGRQRAVGDDLRDALAPVLVGDVLDDPVAPLHAEVDVEVRHRYALGIQEPLEQQVVLDRVQVGDAERERHQRARTRAAARSDRDAVLARPADEVGDDQEVSGEAHAADDAEFELEPRRVRRAVPLGAAQRLRLLEPRSRGRAPILPRRNPSVVLPAGTG